MSAMSREEIEIARQSIAHAKQVRESLAGAAASSDGGALQPLAARSLAQMIELAETLLAEQEKYESRLHRSHTFSISALNPTPQH